MLYMSTLTGTCKKVFKEKNQQLIGASCRLSIGVIGCVKAECDCTLGINTGLKHGDDSARR